ncbi:MAG: lipase family alpha/beta hydrolase [Bacteroidota bacterium]
MRKSIFIFLILLGIFSTHENSQASQPGTAKVILLNRQEKATTQITDGDTVRIQVTLYQPVQATQNISFTLDGASAVLGSCTLPAGKTSCTTDPFPSLGWYWTPEEVSQSVRMVNALSEQGQPPLGSSAPIHVKPRPVVMVHGFISNWQTWQHYLGPDGFLASIGLQGFAVGDGQVPGLLNTGVITNPAGQTNTLAQNAQILGEYIGGVKHKTGAEMVDLVVHSMGGIISRYYIDRVMKDRDVAQLIMLGSPMGGSDCSVLPAALGFYLPASLEIRESYMRGVFNQQITHRKGIEFHDLGGTAINDAFKSPCTEVPNDTVVSFESINAIPLQSSKEDVIHSELTLSGTAFNQYVKPLLQKPAGSFVSQPDPTPAAPTESPLEFTRVYKGHVDAGGSTELTINIEPDVAVASFALYDASRSVDTIVRGASGNIIELNPEKNSFLKVDDPSSMVYLGYGFDQPKPGPWKVTVQATDSTPVNGTDFAISVYFAGGAKLQAGSSSLVPQLKQPVQLDAQVSLNGQPLQIQQAQAVITHPDGKIETLDFPSGQHVSVTWTPNETGTHGVDIVVTALAPDGSSIERTGFLAIEVQPNPSKTQINLNLVAVVAIVLLVLGAILFGLIKLIRRLCR